MKIARILNDYGDYDWWHMYDDLLFECHPEGERCWLFVGDSYCEYTYGYVSKAIANYLQSKAEEMSILDLLTTTHCLNKLGIVKED